MKILLLGKNGQVGHALQSVLSGLGELVSWGREDADLADIDALRAQLHGQRFDVIVNAAAYTAVDKAEGEADLAARINAQAPGVLGEHAASSGARLVHFSTDYVFDGEKAAPYLETDAPHPLSAYGRSKRDGEAAIAASGANALVFRTSWVFSEYGNNFIKTILRLAREREALDVVSDQFGAPTSAALIAAITARALSRADLAPGLYHLSAAGCTNWHALACFVVARARANGLPLKLQVQNIRAVKTEHYPLPAVRPKNSRLDTHRLAAALDVDFPDWTIDVEKIVDILSTSS